MGTYTAMPIVVCWFNMNLGGHHRRSVGSAWQVSNDPRFRMNLLRRLTLLQDRLWKYGWHHSRVRFRSRGCAIFRDWVLDLPCFHDSKHPFMYHLRIWMLASESES